MSIRKQKGMSEEREVRDSNSAEMAADDVSLSQFYKSCLYKRELWK
jgi:hypothetical protein